LRDLGHGVERCVASVWRVSQDHAEAGDAGGEPEVRRSLCERLAVVDQRLFDELALVGIRLLVAQLDRQQFASSVTVRLRLRRSLLG